MQGRRACTQGDAGSGRFMNLVNGEEEEVVPRQSVRFEPRVLGDDRPCRWLALG